MHSARQMKMLSSIALRRFLLVLVALPFFSPGATRADAQIQSPNGSSPPNPGCRLQADRGESHRKQALHPGLRLRPLADFRSAPPWKRSPSAKRPANWARAEPSTHIAYTFSYSSAGTKLEFPGHGRRQVCSRPLFDFVWFTDQELLQKVHERVPLFNGELPSSWTLARSGLGHSSSHAGRKRHPRPRRISAHSRPGKTVNWRRSSIASPMSSSGSTTVEFPAPEPANCPCFRPPRKSSLGVTTTARFLDCV
jgi:hypothetical protein